MGPQPDGCGPIFLPLLAARDGIPQIKKPLRVFGYCPGGCMGGAGGYAFGALGCC